MNSRLLFVFLLAAALLVVPGCGCIPEPDPNLTEKPCSPCRQRNAKYGVSPVVPYKIEGGKGWR